MDNTTNKLYYSIGEVSEMFGVNSSLIRFWEKEFTGLKPKKNKKGNRLFTAKDIELLKKIYILVKDKGYTLDGAKQQLKNGEEPLVHAEIIDKLTEIRNELTRLSREL